MKIYRIAQFISILYQGSDIPQTTPIQGKFLTPDPILAKKDGKSVSAYQIKYDHYYSPDIGEISSKDCKLVRNFLKDSKNCKQALWSLLSSPTNEWIEYLKTMGYKGFINGDYFFLFEPELAKYLGIYDFDNGTIKK